MAELRNSLPQGLLTDVENILNVTWKDAATDERYKILIAGGITYLSNKLGITDKEEFTHDGQPRNLLFEYVRYARDNALEVFEANFLALILSAQNERKIADVVSDQTDE